MKLPQMPEGLTPAWLTVVLRERGLPAQAEITAVAQEQLGDGTGMMSEIARLRLTIKGEAPEFPRTLVAKFPSRNPVNRESAMGYRVYEREVRYFQELDAQTDARSPQIYFVDREADNFLILMADMGDYAVGDQATGGTLAQTELMVDALARLHGGFWGQVDALDWVPGIAGSYHADTMLALCELGWQNMTERFPDQLPTAIAGQGAAFFAALPGLQARMAEAPITLLHGDFRMENVLFGTQANHEPVVIIDWQGPLLGKGMVDVALMLAQSTQSAVRSAHERALIARYVGELVKVGVSDYDQAQAWHDYREAVLYNWVYVAVVSGTLDVHNERAFAWMSQMVARQAVASEELAVFELLATP
ncbi:MAG: phosphotransferase [Pseudomonadota bacterium]